MSEMPKLVEKYLNYQRVIKGCSDKTIDQYEIDLKIFFRYITAKKNNISLDDMEVFNSINISTLDEETILGVTSEDIYEYFYYVTVGRENIARTRARKLSALKSFYKYLCVTLKLIDESPVMPIESPSIKSSLPKYLSIEESVDLLDAINGDVDSNTKKRDYAIVTLFLNSGMRLSELAGINMNDIDRELRSMRILGKRNKERMIYLNEACVNALKEYLEIRPKDVQPEDKNALFISNQNKRISIKTIQWMVKKYLKLANLENKNYSVHKLRHTAATLMYQTGQVDVRVLKDILGHEQLNTTQIYTHVSDASMENAMRMNPLAKIKMKEKKYDEHNKKDNITDE